MDHNQDIKCAVYCRYSTYLQKDTSIEDQLRADQGFADSRKWELLKDQIYIDKCTSGTKIERKGLNALLKTAKGGKAPFKYILVYDTSRFARTPHKALLEANELAYYGIHVYFVRQGIDTADKNSTAQLALHGIIDHQYIEQLSESTKRGVEGQVNRGYSGGGATFGYTSVPDRSSMTRNGRPLGYKLEIERVTAKTIRLIFQLCGLIGWSLTQIVNYLNEAYNIKDIHRPPKGDRWRVSTVSGILRNEKYTGKLTWNRTTKIKNYITGQEKLVVNPENKWVRREAEELRIISNELWDRVRFRLTALNRRANHKYVETKRLFSKHLLTPIARCGACNNPFAIVSGGKYAHYGCTANHNSGVSVCTNSFKVSKFLFERKILAMLHAEYLSSESLTLLCDEIHRSLTQYTLDQLNQDIRTKQAEAEEENRSLLDAIKRGENIGIKPDTLLFELSQNEAQRRELDNLLAKEIDIDVTRLLTTDDLRDYFERILDNLTDPIKSNEALQKLVEKIIVYPRGDNLAEIEVIENVECTSSYIINLAQQRSGNVGSIRYITGTHRGSWHRLRG